MRRTLVLLVALLACLGLVAGCGTSGGDATTSATGGSEEPAEPVTTEQLEALLPTAEEVGAEYTESTDDSSDDDSSDDEMDQQFEEACPGISELAFLDSAPANDDDSVSASFTTEDDREVQVDLDPTVEQLTEENIDDVVAALSECDEIEVSDEEGFSFTISIDAERDDTYGDFGLRMDFDAVVSAFGLEIPLTFAGQAFSVDGIGVTVSATSGLLEDEMEMTPVPYDEDVLASVSELMEQRVGEL